MIGTMLHHGPHENAAIETYLPELNDSNVKGGSIACTCSAMSLSSANHCSGVFEYLYSDDARAMRRTARGAHQ